MRWATVRAGEPAGLGVGDGALDATSQLQAELGELRRLARAGLAGHHDDLVAADGVQQLLAARGDRQLGRISEGRHRRPAAGEAPLGIGRGW
ncbi:MAG: hypothetical protein MSC31_12260 [Solirubrobacteraceae bacterium MAG38_C4-C5]|nr:hypothetical protein [Candidatus Siliceabacter maunaloa]